MKGVVPMGLLFDLEVWMNMAIKGWLCVKFWSTGWSFFCDMIAGTAALSARCTNYHTRGSWECEGCIGKWRWRTQGWGQEESCASQSCGSKLGGPHSCWLARKYVQCTWWSFLGTQLPYLLHRFPLQIEKLIHMLIGWVLSIIFEQMITDCFVATWEMRWMMRCWRKHLPASPLSTWHEWAPGTLSFLYSELIQFHPQHC